MTPVSGRSDEFGSKNRGKEKGSGTISWANFNILAAKALVRMRMAPAWAQEANDMFLHHEILPRLAAFLDHRHFVVREEQRDKSFGSGLTTLEGDGFRIRMIQDRGEINIEVGQIGRQPWFALENVLEFLTGAVVTDPDAALQSHFLQVSELMKSDLEKSGYMAFERRKTELAIQRLFPS